MAKQELIASVKDGQHASFLTLLQNHRSKRSTLDLKEVILELSRVQKEELWMHLHSWGNEQLTKLIPEEPSEGDIQNEQHSAQSEDKPGGKVQQSNQNEKPTQIDGSGGQGVPDPWNQEPLEPYNEKLMEGIIEFACIYLNAFQDDEIYIPDKLLELTVLLHGIVKVLEGSVQRGVLSLCELWWLKRLEERDHTIGNALPLLIGAATTKSAQKKDVIRLWAIHDALQVVNLSNPENKPLVEKLVVCAASAIFLSCDEGIKWLALLFSWDFLVPHLHQAIKSLLPECTRLQSEKIAGVYLRAWKNSQGNVRQALEEDCIQDLMYAAIHVDPMSGRLSANLHHLLHHIHRHKRHHVVATTIFTLYDPFLWRSLKAANGLVRMNATGLLSDAFPLTDSSLNQEERNNLLERQYQEIITLLLDPCHLVRIAAIKGVFTILSEFWLMIPSRIIKIIFQKLLSDLLYDASSAEARTQVIKGLTVLVDCRDAIPFLTEVLPRQGDAFDDISVNVRIAFVKLLLKVKSSKVSRYWEIVPVHHLLHRLEDDKPVVCKLLTQLLLNSFHPVHREDQDLLHRSLTLLEENRAAARRFYQYASRKLDLPSTVHFMLLIWRCLRNYALAQKAQESSFDEEPEISDIASPEGQPFIDGQASNKGSALRRGPFRVGHGSGVPVDDKENAGVDGGTDGQAEDDDDGSSPLDNPALVGGLLDTIVILWTTNAHRLALPQNMKYLEALRTRISKSMPLFFKIFKDNNEVSQTLLYLSSFLPRTLVPTLVGHCLSRLRALQSDQDNEDTHATYINALCNWNRADDVLELASEWLERGFKSGLNASIKERRRSRGRGVRFCETNSPQPLIALRLIRQILKHPLNKLSALDRNRHLFLEITENMSKVKDMIGERLRQTEELSPLCSDVFLCECWAQYLSLIAVLHNPSLEGQEPHDLQDKDDDGENPDDLLFNSSAILSLCLDWANSVVVPALVEEIPGKRKLRAADDAVAIVVSVLNNLLVTSTHLLMIGAADGTFAYRICGFVDSLLKKDVSGSFWEKSLLLALEAHRFLEAYDLYHEENEAAEDGTPVDVMNSCMTSTLAYFRLHEDLPKNAVDLKDTLVMVLSSLGQNFRRYQNEVMVHVAATVVEHVCWIVDKSKGVDTEVTKIIELGGYTSLMVGACQSNAKLATALMNSLAHFVTTAVHDITSLLAVSYLLTILVNDSEKISRYSLKQVVVAADSILSSIIIPVSSDTEEGESSFVFGFYEEYAKTTKVLIEDLKSSLGVL